MSDKFEEDLIEVMLEHVELYKESGSYTNPHLIKGILELLEDCGVSITENQICKDQEDKLHDWMMSCWEM